MNTIDAVALREMLQLNGGAWRPAGSNRGAYAEQLGRHQSSQDRAKAQHQEHMNTQYGNSSDDVSPDDA